MSTRSSKFESALREAENTAKAVQITAARAVSCFISGEYDAAQLKKDIDDATEAALETLAAVRESINAEEKSTA